jgi:hypothetical protein
VAAAAVLKPTRLSVSRTLSPALEDVLAYRNDEIVFRFSEDHGVSPADAEELFTEVKRWLWLCCHQKRAQERGESRYVAVPLLSEARAVDLMWHTFLLFTEDYAAFCDRYFGFFIHHIPQTRKDAEAWRAKLEADRQSAIQERRAVLKPAYELIYDVLGKDVLIRWVEEYPKRFTLL